MPARRDPSSRTEGRRPKAPRKEPAGAGRSVCRLWGFDGAAACVGDALAGVGGGGFVERSLRPYLAIRDALSVQIAMARVALETAADRSASFSAVERISAPSGRVRVCCACG
jgi:hypothetical protein